jgi:hypothetical protein
VILVSKVRQVQLERRDHRDRLDSLVPLETQAQLVLLELRVLTDSREIPDTLEHPVPRDWLEQLEQRAWLVIRDQLVRLES